MNKPYLIISPVAVGLALSSPAFGQNLGFSDWGSADNAAGGSAAAPYVTFDNQAAALQDTVDGDNGIINFGRVILDYNLATPGVIASGGVKITVDINPTDAGEDIFPGANANGRDWGALVLGDTNDGGQFADPSTKSVGGAGYLFGNNQDARFGVGPRNSGSALIRRGPANKVLDGKPDPDIAEPIFDATAFSDYVAWYNGGDGTAAGDPVDSFANPNWYTMQIEITPGAGVTLFDDDALHIGKVFIGPQGGALTRLDLDPSTPGVIEEEFFWGDNINTTGLDDPTPGGKDAYLVFLGNAGAHLFDNLLIEDLNGVAVLSDSFSRVAGDPGGAIEGDLDGDGFVGIDDLNLVLGNWNQNVPPGDPLADPSGDGFVGIDDLNTVLGNWNAGTPPTAGAAIPEPTSLALIGLGTIAAMHRRR